MKKTLILIISILAITGMTSAVYAGTYTGSTGSVAIGTTSDTGGQLTANLSPGVAASVITDSKSYGISTVNIKADTDAIGYNLWSGSGSLYMKAFSSTPTAADTPSLTGEISGYNSK